MYSISNSKFVINLQVFRICLNLTYELRHELQQFVFPKAATYNKENYRVRTPETHLFFELTKRTTGLCENKKSGTLS